MQNDERNNQSAEQLASAELQSGGVTVSRRSVFGIAAGAAGLALASGCQQPTGTAHSAGLQGNTKAPFKSMRDYLAALDAEGLVLRIPKVDQDAYEATALMYRARDQHGMRGAPCFMFDEVKISGNWTKGPLLVNESGNLHAECIAFGLQPVDPGPISTEPFGSYRRARDHVEALLLANDGDYPTIPPVVVEAAAAPCKEVVLLGDEIDLTKFAFIQGNPADAGRYINTGQVYTRHPKYGVNFGTYRCHLRGPRELGLNSEPGQTGYRHLKAAQARGEKIAKVSIVLTPDPYVWMVAGSKMSFGKEGLVDELSIAGGLGGQAIETVRCETNDFMVPANAEMIIEGEVPLDDMRPEGPYAEMVGYQGKVKDEVFWLRVTAVTHRRNPWLMNNFTGEQAGTLMAAGHARSFMRLKQQHPAVVDFFPDTRAVGFAFCSIKKERAGQGLEIAEAIVQRDFFAKIVVVVDDDIDVMDHNALLAAIGARWQPFGNLRVYEEMPALPLDPSSVRIGKSSKIAIDATRKWPEENGPEVFPESNEALFLQGAPEAFSNVDARWGDELRLWRPDLK
jgi:4-hydroxy-3-polyprenylbenzoate decarboxylase